MRLKVGVEFRGPEGVGKNGKKRETEVVEIDKIEGRLVGRLRRGRGKGKREDNRYTNS